MPIESGRYIITHTQYCNLAFLSDTNDGTSLLGCLEQDVPGEEWNIKELRNGRYSIVNFGHKMSASAEFHSKKGDHVVGRETDWLWLITEHDAGKYTFSTANGKLRWFLEDDWPKTPVRNVSVLLNTWFLSLLALGKITLDDAPPSDPRCHWTFQKIGRVNTAPYKAAKEEAEKAKAEVVRTLAELEKARREVEKAKEEAEEHKEAFRSYFNMMSQLNIGTYTITNVLDNEQPRPSQASLFWAAEMGHIGVVQLILEQEGVDVNFKTMNGWIPFHLASQNGHKAVVQLLLAQEGVDVNFETTNGCTPLHLASQNGHDAVVRLLLAQEGVDVNFEITNGTTPLRLASQNGHDMVVRLLLARDGVNVNSKHITGATPLLSASENGHDVVVRLLLARNDVVVNSKDTDGATPLYVASINGHDVVVRLLLARVGVDVNSRFKTGATPLLIASVKGRDAVVRLLLVQNGVDANVMDNTGRTPLMWAEENKHKAVARLLREKIRRMGNATQSERIW